MEPEDGEEAQAQHPPRREKALGRGCWAVPSPPRQKGGPGRRSRAAPRSRAHVQAAALRDLHGGGGGGSPGGARGSGDLARSGAGNAPAAEHRGGASSEHRRELTRGRSRPPAGQGRDPLPSPGRPSRHLTHGRSGARRGAEVPVPAAPAEGVAHLHSDRATPGGRGTAPRRRREEEEARTPLRLSPLPLRSVPCAAPSALRLAAAPRSNTAPPAAARGPSFPHWLRRTARRSPIG